ncbi:hypothetical protein V1281_004221 [Nitrobacteraceae bacterium AZCC 2161]
MIEKINSAAAAIQKELCDYVCSESFQRVLCEVSSLPEALRHEFVEFVLLDEEQLAIRNILPPAGIAIQRSYFADRRPTLFCVTKKVPEGLLWKKITITFDNDSIGLSAPPFACDENGDLLPFLS